ARRRGRASEPAHSPGGLVRRRLVRTWPRTAPARPERVRGVLVRRGHEAAAGQLDLPAAGLDAGRSGSRALLRDGLAHRGQAAGRGVLLPSARALTSPACRRSEASFCAPAPTIGTLVLLLITARRAP